MKNIYAIIKIAAVSALIAGTATSCLEKNPGSYIPEEDAMKTLRDAEQHNLGIYASLKSSSLYSGLLTLLPDIQSDLVMASLTNTNPHAGIWEWDIRPTNREIEAVYGSLYSVIGNCNFFLEKEADVRATLTAEEDFELLDQYTGEAYAIRALCYSELIKCFCEAYDPDNADNQLGVVLRTKHSEKEPIKRASLKASYQQVLDDLDMAEQLLDDGDDDPTVNDGDESDNYYISLAAVYAIRARVSLYMENWDDAIKYSTYVIDNKAFELSGTSVNPTYGYAAFDCLWGYDSGDEIIWRIGFTGTSYGGALGTVFLDLTRDNIYAYPDYVPAEWVLDLYTQSDYRYTMYFSDLSESFPVGYSYEIPVPLIVKYYGNQTFITGYQLYHVCMPKPLRLAEQYLIRAEASYWNGDTNQAGNDLTTLSRNRGGGAVTVASGEAGLEAISNERVKELYLEGFRLNDLKRWNMGFERTPNSYSQTTGNDLKVEAGDPLFVWPIPQHEIESPDSDLEGNESNNR